MSSSKALGYIPALDGLRLMCCLAVIAAHSFVSTPLSDLGDNLGRLGVDAFFTLSGFLITKLLLEEADATGQVDLKAFYIRRTIRIWPVYYVAMLGFALPSVLGGRLNSVFGYEPQPGLLTEALPLHLLFLANWVSTTALPTPLQVLWSISVEEQFYLVFPGLFVLARRIAARRQILIVALVLMLAALVARASLAFPTPPISKLRHTWVVSDFLLMGAIAAQLRHEWPDAIRKAATAAGRWFELLAGLMLVGLCVFEPFNVGAAITPWSFIFYNPLVATLFALLVLHLSVSDGAAGLTRWLATPWAARLGRVTYAAYVFHIYAVAVGWAIANRLGERSGVTAGLLRTVLAVPLAFALAFVSKWVIENPFARLRHRSPKSEPVGVTRHQTL